MRLASASALLLASCLGCGVTRAGAVAASAPALATGSYVSLEKDAGGVGWIATWHLDSAATELRFERRASGFRRDVFEVLTPGFTMQHDGGTEVLRTSGGPARRIAVRFPEFDRELPKEYAFFRRFTDGSVAIYTGHLVARPATRGVVGCDSCHVRRLRVTPPRGSRVVIGGRQLATSAEWTDTTGEGTYVYIGGIVPAEVPGVVAVTDPALPRWLDARWRELLPALFAFYADRFDAASTARRTVLFDYRPSDVDGHMFGGGVLPGLIQLGAEGRAWETESPDALVRVAHFLAHEAAHVWNAELVRAPATADPWIHEGSADALAQRALLALALIDETRFLEFQTAALNECRAGIGSRSVRDAGRAKPALVYACGNMLALLTETSLPRRDQASLFDVWRRIIADARARGGSYSYASYLDAWRALGAGEDDVRTLTSLLDGTGAGDALTAALVARGVAIEADTVPPTTYTQTLGRDALLALQVEDCGGRASFEQRSGGLLVAGGLRCATLPAGVLVTTIGGHDVIAGGHRAWGHLVERCGSAQPVVVGFVATADGAESAGSVALTCREPVAARPAYVRITSRPRS